MSTCSLTTNVRLAEAKRIDLTVLIHTTLRDLLILNRQEGLSLTQPQRLSSLRNVYIHHPRHLNGYSYRQEYFWYCPTYCNTQMKIIDPIQRGDVQKFALNRSSLDLRVTAGIRICHEICQEESHSIPTAAQEHTTNEEESHLTGSKESLGEDGMSFQLPAVDVGSNTRLQCLLAIFFGIASSLACIASGIGFYYGTRMSGCPSDYGGSYIYCATRTSIVLPWPVALLPKQYPSPLTRISA